MVKSDPLIYTDRQGDRDRNIHTETNKQQINRHRKYINIMMITLSKKNY